MKIAVPKERAERERRVALTPDICKKLTKAGFQVLLEQGAGEGAYFTDEHYRQAGASIELQPESLYAQADVVLKVNPPTPQEASLMKEGAVLIGLLYAYTQPALVEVCLQRRITLFAIDAIPRISRAQKMDALSSQANLAGYKAVLMGANALGKIFPLLMTAAGTITPARVLVFGAGVAGLQAVATARRLGAVVEVTDPRPETKEEVESLGGRFLEVEAAGIKTEGGYAREVSEDFLRRQKELISQRIREADLVITTALVIGKPAPRLISEDMLRSMKAGSVIVDMAVASGGNCALSQKDRTVVHHGVTIIGESNLPSLLPVNASELYARNIYEYLMHLATPEGFRFDMQEEITASSIITHKGELLHKLTKEILEKR